MLDVYSRHRPLSLLAATVLAQVLLLAFQVKRERGAHEVRLIRYWAVEITTPVERAGTWVLSRVGGMWHGYVGLRETRDENEKLRGEVEHLRLRNRELESQAAEAQRLAGLLSFREAHPEAPMLAAQVIGASADATSHTLFINRGDHDHVRRDMPVVTPDGVVGKIVEVFPTSAQVLLINDKDSGVGALFADTRTHGVIKGTGDPEPRMDYVENNEKVPDGTAIVTSGEDRIFPKDFPIGTVISAEPGNPFQVIHVKTSARLDRLEDVLVLLSRQEVNLKKAEVAASSPAATAPVKAPAPAPAPANTTAAPKSSSPAKVTPHPAAQSAPKPAAPTADQGSANSSGSSQPTAPPQPAPEPHN
jgi:rod shape-determining protein MreC